MKSEIKRRRRTRRSSTWLRQSLWTSVAVVAALGVVAVALAGVTRFPATVTSSVASASPAPQDETDTGEPSTSTRAVVVYVTQYGFEPTEMTIPAGQYTLIVRNSSGLPNLALSAHGLVATTVETGRTADGVPAPGVDVPISLAESKVFAQPFLFVPGTITLSDPDVPGRVCQIFVTP